jgi:glutaredoxin
MDIKIYSVSGCSWCSKVKELMRRADVSYEEIMINRDIPKEEFRQLYPEINSYPYVVIDGEGIGGVIPTVKYFVEKGLVSSKNK